VANRIKPRRTSAFAVGLLVLMALVLGGCGSSGPQDTNLRVSGNQLVIGPGSGRVVQLRGINRSGTEYKCFQGTGFFDSPTPDQPDSPAMVSAMKSWDIDVVRVPLNEGCWLGMGAPSQYSGAAYRQAIEAYVQELNNAGLFVILSLQWLDIDGSADYEPPMPDAANAPSFWRSVAGTFKSDKDVLFDLYNEPFDVDWSCWLNGCEVPAGSGAGGGGATSWPAYQAVGMQRLVNAVRITGATQPLLIGGVDYALDLSGWLSHEPTDPDHNLIASIHSYGGRSPCSSSCQSTVLSVNQKVPVLFGELGEVDCGTSYIDQTMAFADQHKIGYLGWAWDAVAPGSWTCTGGPSLIDSYDGTPTTYGAGFQSHFQSLGAAIAAPPASDGAASFPAAGTTSSAEAEAFPN
jgi:endoglucanase